MGWSDSQDKARNKKWGIKTQPVEPITAPVPKAVRGDNGTHIDHGSYIEHIPAKSAKAIDDGLDRFSKWINNLLSRKGAPSE